MTARTEATGAPALPAGGRAPDALSPPRGNPRFPLVDGVRGFAMITVLVFHAALLAGALRGGEAWNQWLAVLTIGPQMFFMFSGFLLYRPFLAARVRGTRRPTFGEYFRNRSLRVIPAYWVALTIFAIYPGLPGDVFGNPLQYYGMVHIYWPETVLGGLNVSWTLCTELTFYLALPLAVVGLDAVARRTTPARARTIEMAVWFAVIALSWVYVEWLFSLGEMTPARFGWVLALPGQAAFFAMGMILARLAVPNPGERPLRDRIPNWVVASTLCWLAALAVYALRIELRPGGGTATLLNGVVGFLILLPAIFAAPGDRGPERVMGLRVMRWLGLIAYGTYLAHYPLLHELADRGVGGPTFGGFLEITALATAGSVLFGILSYNLVEKPALKLKRGIRRGRREPVPVTT